MTINNKTNLKDNLLTCLLTKFYSIRLKFFLKNIQEKRCFTYFNKTRYCMCVDVWFFKQK